VGSVEREPRGSCKSTCGSDMRFKIMYQGSVFNIVEWDGRSDWKPPEGTTLEPLADDETVIPFAAPIPDKSPGEKLVAALIAKGVITLDDIDLSKP